VAGICDYTNYKCLNCQNQGHRARDKYRPRHPRKTGRARDKGKERAHDGVEDIIRQIHTTSTVVQNNASSSYQFPTEEQFAELFSELQGGPSCGRTGWDEQAPPREPVASMEADGRLTPGGNPDRSASQQMEYSPSRPQISAANQTLTSWLGSRHQ
jgi:hypothetical protein